MIATYSQGQSLRQSQIYCDLDSPHAILSLPAPGIGARKTRAVAGNLEPSMANIYVPENVEQLERDGFKFLGFEQNKRAWAGRLVGPIDCPEHEGPLPDGMKAFIRLEIERAVKNYFERLA